MKNIEKGYFALSAFTALLYLLSFESAAHAEAVSFNVVELNYSRVECSFKYSPINFCDQKHIEKYNAALRDSPVNFNRHYTLLAIKEWRDSDEKSLVAIDQNTGTVYPVPIDSFSPSFDSTRRAERHAKLDFSENSDRVCINGSILVYRATQTGKFCFRFDGTKFFGYHTAYMRYDQP